MKGILERWTWFDSMLTFLTRKVLCHLLLQSLTKQSRH